MAAGTPLTRLALGASSVADDLGYVALNDLAIALGDIAADYRVIGGHMVTMLVARWQLGAGLYRETRDVDLGVPPIVARDQRVTGRLRDVSYHQVEGNRFARVLSDIPAGMTDSGEPPKALIDILVPAYKSRPRANIQVGEDLFTTEVLGLDLALARFPVMMSLELRRLNGQMLQCELPFADELSALVLKGLATRVRFKDTDIADVWRCLEVAYTAGLSPADFSSGARAEGAQLIRELFDSRRSSAMTALATEQHLSTEAADKRYTRIRALITRVLGPA